MTRMAEERYGAAGRLPAVVVALACLASVYVLARPLPPPADGMAGRVAVATAPADIVAARATRWPAVLAGPVPARVIRVVDGDTLVVQAYVWVGQAIEVAVRIRGVDAPETRGRCARERELAARATRWLEAAVGDGEVSLTHISGGKYFGRVVAEVAAADGSALGPGLLAAGLARPYDGGRREGWCATAG